MYLPKSFLATLLTSLTLATPLPAPLSSPVISAVNTPILHPRATIGTATILNSCTFPVYLVEVSGTTGPTITLTKGQSYSETYHNTANGGGPSIKIAKNNPITPSQPITQFEYVLSGSNVFYDVSLVNGNAFAVNGFSLKPSVASCPSFTCKANAAGCSQAYTTWNDEGTKACVESAGLRVTLCG